VPNCNNPATASEIVILFNYYHKTLAQNYNERLRLLGLTL
jgi:hypothetical protein